MDFWTIIQTYLLISTGLAITSYITLYRPAIAFLEEIVEQKTRYSGPFGAALWTIIAFVFSPYILFILLSNNNRDFIELFAVTLAERAERADKE
jgi:hypothetical protein